MTTLNYQKTTPEQNNEAVIYLQFTAVKKEQVILQNYLNKPH
jgi:hypothetical protein